MIPEGGVACMSFIDHPEELIQKRREWAELPAFEKRRRLYVRQKEMLKLLMEKGAISRTQYEENVSFLEN